MPAGAVDIDHQRPSLCGKVLVSSRLALALPFHLSSALRGDRLLPRKDRLGKGVGAADGFLQEDLDVALGHDEMPVVLAPPQQWHNRRLHILRL